MTSLDITTLHRNDGRVAFPTRRLSLATASGVAGLRRHALAAGARGGHGVCTVEGSSGGGKGPDEGKATRPDV